MAKEKWAYGIHYYQGSLETVVDEFQMNYQNCDVIQIISNNSKCEIAVVYREKVTQKRQKRTVVDELLLRAINIIGNNEIKNTEEGKDIVAAMNFLREAKAKLGVK